MWDAVDLLERIVCVDRWSMPRRVVRQENEGDHAHLHVALGLVDGHDPFRLRKYICAMEEVVLELHRLLAQLGDDTTFHVLLSTSKHEAPLWLVICTL